MTVLIYQRPPQIGRRRASASSQAARGRRCACLRYIRFQPGRRWAVPKPDLLRWRHPGRRWMPPPYDWPRPSGRRSGLGPVTGLAKGGGGGKPVFYMLRAERGVAGNAADLAAAQAKVVQVAIRQDAQLSDRLAVDLAFGQVFGQIVAECCKARTEGCISAKCLCQYGHLSPLISWRGSLVAAL